MPYARPDALVSTQWLHRHLAAPDVRVVDATWFMPGSGRNAREEYCTTHIPGAVFFDIDDIAESATPLPHMLPPAEKFASRVQALGLGDGCRIVVYDRHGLMTAARVWWMFRVFGHQDVAILDGGLPKWRAAGLPVDDQPADPRARPFHAAFNHILVRELDQVKACLGDSREQLVDARSRERFAGTAPEVWAKGRRGHIPGAISLPFNELLNPADQTVLPAEALVARMEAAGIDLARPITTSCGSGVTACVLALAFYLVGKTDVAVYDGSWAEWGLHPELPCDCG